MRMLQSTDLYRMIPDKARAHTIFAILLWSGVTVFIFGIVTDFFH